VTLVHIDPIAGASGHMLLGALLDAGVQESAVLDLLDELPLSGWQIEVTEVLRGGLGATRVAVASDAAEVVRTWSNVRELLTRAPLPDPVRARAIGTFRRLAEAEARVHRVDTDRAHFHEIDVLDAIVTVVGVCVAFHLLDTRRVTCGPVPQGIGMARSARGHVPLPAPTVMELLAGAPTYSAGIQAELCSPTGAALLAEWADAWSELPYMTVHRTGYGAGNGELDRPNVLRVLVGEPATAGSSTTALLLATLVPELPEDRMAALRNALREAGATEVWTRSVVGSTDEPAFEVACLAPIEAGGGVRRALLREAGSQRAWGRMVDSWDLAEQEVHGPTPRSSSAGPLPPTTA
jgi:pyridinium-3,5-bisthiocarboxylic acid mononucleotide nickel chelatase